MRILTRRVPRLIVGIGFSLIVFGPAGCGLPEQERAEVIEDVPADVRAVDATPNTVPAKEVDAAPFSLVLYWHEGNQGRLIRVARPWEAQPTPEEALTQLIKGPTGQEREETAGVEFFGPDTGLTDAELAPVLEGPVDGVIKVTVGGVGFRELPNKANVGAELVCTLTELDGIDGVVVYDAQPEPINLVGSNAESIEGPARRSNFGDCVTVDPPPPDETTTTSASN